MSSADSTVEEFHTVAFPVTTLTLVSETNAYMIALHTVRGMVAIRMSIPQISLS